MFEEDRKLAVGMLAFFGAVALVITYEGACRAAEAEIKRRIRNRMAVL